MKITKANWVNHESQPIYSVDIQRGDVRFATGGQSSSGSGLVIIWSFQALINQDKEGSDKNLPKIFTRLENHSACVNCVRWSENGKFLASAGGDQIIMIWQYAGLNAFDKINKETWKCTSTLRGHQGDILHLAWSPGDRYLASCSIDNTIIVWSVNKFPNKTAVLEGHKGFVKGVTWDPTGKFLASQSDDKSVKIWSTSNWTCFKTITKPFEESGVSTHFLRLDWSPDGTSLASVHSMNNGGPVAKIINRKDWTHNNEFVGHRKAICCLKFSPTIYEPLKQPDSSRDNGNSPKLCTYCCCGSKDRSISIWGTIYNRPLVVIQNLFMANVMDISWAPTGCQKLLACSTDGSVALIEFLDLELGKPLNSLQKQNHLKLLHGSGFMQNLTNGVQSSQLNDDEDSSDMIIDDPQLLNLHMNHNNVIKNEEKLEIKNDNCQNMARNVAPVAKEMVLESKEEPPKNTLPVQKMQIESRTKDGKRKIQPIFLGNSVVTEDPALKQAELIESCGSNTHGVTLNQPAAATSDNVTQAPTSFTPAPANFTPAPINFTPPPINFTPDKPTCSKTIEDQSANDKNTGVTLHSNKNDQKMTEIFDNNEKFKAAKIKDDENLQTTITKTKKAIFEEKKKRKSRAAIVSDDDDVMEVDEVAKKSDGICVKASEPASVPLNASKNCQIILPVPENKTKLLTSVIQKKDNFEFSKNEKLSFVCENDFNGRISSISCTQNNIRIWQTLLNAPCSALASSSEILIAATVNRQLILISPKNGQLISPYICVDSKIAILNCSFSHIIILTINGTIYVWHFQHIFRLVLKESLKNIGLNDFKDLKVQYANLSPNFEPVIGLSNGCTYLYSYMYNSWILVQDVNDVIKSISSIKAPPFGRPGSFSLATPDQNSALFPANETSLANFGNQGRAMATLSYVEQMLNSALALKSKSDYEFWLLQYAQELIRQGNLFKTRSLCQDLLNKTKQYKNSVDLEKMNVDHKSLLHKILAMVSKNSKLQRLYKEFIDQLEKPTIGEDFL